MSATRRAQPSPLPRYRHGLLFPAPQDDEGYPGRAAAAGRRQELA